MLSFRCCFATDYHWLSSISDAGFLVMIMVSELLHHSKKTCTIVHQIKDKEENKGRWCNNYLAPSITKRRLQCCIITIHDEWMTWIDMKRNTVGLHVYHYQETTMPLHDDWIWERAVQLVKLFYTLRVLSSTYFVCMDKSFSSISS